MLLNEQFLALMTAFECQIKKRTQLTASKRNQQRLITEQRLQSVKAE